MSRNQKVLDMNKTEIITEVSQMTSVSVTDCEKVLDALEEVLGIVKDGKTGFLT